MIHRSSCPSRWLHQWLLSSNPPSLCNLFRSVHCITTADLPYTFHIQKSFGKVCLYIFCLPHATTPLNPFTYYISVALFIFHFYFINFLLTISVSLYICFILIALFLFLSRIYVSQMSNIIIPITAIECILPIATYRSSTLIIHNILS